MAADLFFSLIDSAYILFNFAAVFFFFWITTIVDWSSVHILPQKKEKKEKVEPEAIEA